MLDEEGARRGLVGAGGGGGDDTVEAVEGEAGADTSEWASCDELQKARLRGDRGSSPSIATSSSDASRCTDGGTEGGVRVGGAEKCVHWPQLMRCGEPPARHGCVAHTACPTRFHIGPWDRRSGCGHPGPLIQLHKRYKFQCPIAGLPTVAVICLVCSVASPAACPHPCLFVAPTPAVRCVPPPSPM